MHYSNLILTIVFLGICFYHAGNLLEMLLDCLHMDIPKDILDIMENAKSPEAAIKMIEERNNPNKFKKKTYS